jgi:hypothetical protein
MHFIRFSEQEAITFLNVFNRLFFVTVERFVFSEVGTESEEVSITLPC